MPETAPQKAFERLRGYPLLEALFTRRSRRVSRGASFRSGVLTFTSKHEPQPLSPLEEAVLIAATGTTGVTLADSPFRTENGQPLLPTPLMSVAAGASARPDQAACTYFFVWNDTGTYFVKHADESRPPVNVLELGPSELIAHVESLKVKLRDGRIDFPRRFPAYLGRNRFSSNVPGSTLFVPVLEMTAQYINGLLYLLSAEDGARPAIVDDFNFYRPAGCQKWIRSGFLSRGFKLPLGYLGKARIDYEPLLLLQNLALVAAAMGLGGWLHNIFAASILFGGTDLGAGLNLRFATPAFRTPRLPLPTRVNRLLGSLIRPAVRLRRMLRPFPAGMPNPVGLDEHLRAYCPPYFTDMNAAVDAIVEKKVGPGGLYADPGFFARTMKPQFVPEFLEQTPRYRPETIECVRAICTYIYETYGRFPAHCNAIETPGVCFQAHHPDLDYYDKFFQPRYSRAEREHQHLWHDEARE